MIKPELNLASLQKEDQEKIMKNIMAKRIYKIGCDFGMHVTVIQIAPGKPPKNGKYRWLGDFLALWVYK